MKAFTSLSILTLFFLYGCSGHGLQDWADEHYNDKRALENSSKEKMPTHASTKDGTKRSDTKVSSPSQDKGLNTVSPSKTATSQGGAMQKSLDRWTKEEWTPAIEQNATLKALDEDPDRPFTLQEYVDKVGAYMKNSPKSQGPSHKEKMDALPVIGK